MDNGTQLRMIWAELGLECQLECTVCYAGAGPGGGFGTMSGGDWERVIREAGGLGCEQVIFIGGEPTLSPVLGPLVRLAVSLGMGAEVYSNLVHVSPAMWELFMLPKVSVAASWYTGDRAQHAAITGGHDTWRQTRANIGRAVERGIRVRIGMVDGIVPGQLSEDGERELRALGVAGIGHDRVREFGRGTVADPSQACGRCGHGRAAVLPDGSVTPCPLTRWLAAGNVRETGLEPALEALPAVAAVLPGRGAVACDPDDDGKPCQPYDNDCRPDYYCAPLCAPGACKPSIR
jgi:MoaA/NifB/PqqE/SkfB family radical SAM enzyme